MQPGPNSVAETLLHDLVAIPSLSFQEAFAVQHLVGWMSANGFDEARVDAAGNAVGIVGSGNRDVVLLGHIDTVGGFPHVHIAGRKLYGRGTVDAKGPLCVFAVAAARARIGDNLRVIVVGAVEEEAATSKGARHAMNCYNPELCVIGEPSRWDRITLGYKGRLLCDWRWEGGMSHSAGDAPSPAEIAIDFWLRVKCCTDAYNREIDSIFSSLDASVRSLNTRNVDVNSVAEMAIGFRLPPGVDPDDIVDMLPQSDDATVTWRGAEFAYTADRNSELSRHFRRAIRAHGGVPRFVYKTGTSDMNVVGPRWLCPIVAYGPGDSALDHTPNEHINLDEYLQSIDVLTTVLESL